MSELWPFSQLTPTAVSDLYQELAPVYDAVMDHVDYDRWARYVHQCIQTHAEAASEGDSMRDGGHPLSVLELGGGTGSLACRLQPLGGYRYVLTDGAAAMVKQARQKIAGETDGVSPEAVTCAQARFPDIDAPEVVDHAPYDAIVLVYDGLNYLTHPSEVTACFDRMNDMLRVGGIVVVDHATPANSEDNDAEFTDRGMVNGVSYVRHSRYDAATQRHHTRFEIVRGGRCIREEHIQQTYAPSTIRDCVDRSSLQEVAAYDGFSFNPAHDCSHRVHWVLEIRD